MCVQIQNYMSYEVTKSYQYCRINLTLAVYSMIRNDRPEMVERMWGMINSKFWYDSRLRCDMVDLYHILYSKRRPFCLPIPELAALGRASASMGMGPSMGSSMGATWPKKSQVNIENAEIYYLETFLFRIVS